VDFLIVLVLFQEEMLKHAGKYKDWSMLILYSLPCTGSQATSILVVRGGCPVPSNYAKFVFLLSFLAVE
jgi:hypothetical protein